MILVTLGTQTQKFERLLNAIENSHLDDEIIVQAGGSADFQSKKMKMMKFINYEEMNELIAKADFIITHGGTGSIIMPLQKNKKVIACARLEKYGEHINDHQKELVSIFAEEGYILELREGQELDEVLKKLKTWEPKKYISNTENFIKNLKEEIDRK